MILLLAIVALIATTAFYTRAKRRGLQPGRAAMLPFVVLGILLVFAHFGGFLLSQVLDMAGTSPQVDWLIRLAFHAFLICAYLAFIRQNWLVLR